jgi:hypothetical protein
LRPSALTSYDSDDHCSSTARRGWLNGNATRRDAARSFDAGPGAAGRG